MSFAYFTRSLFSFRTRHVFRDITLHSHFQRGFRMYSKFKMALGRVYEDIVFPMYNQKQKQLHGDGEEDEEDEDLISTIFKQGINDLQLALVPSTLPCREHELASLFEFIASR